MKSWQKRFEDRCAPQKRKWEFLVSHVLSSSDQLTFDTLNDSSLCDSFVYRGKLRQGQDSSSEDDLQARDACRGFCRTERFYELLIPTPSAFFVSFQPTSHLFFVDSCFRLR